MSVPIPTPSRHPENERGESAALLVAHYGNEPIHFARARRKAGSKSVLIKVHPDCRVTALAPDSTPDNEVIRAVAKRGRWVCQQLANFRQQQEHVLPRQYISGETHLYLGRQYLLKVNVGTDYAVGVKLMRGVLEVYVRDGSAESVKAALSAWYRLRAREVFRARLEKLLPEVLWVDMVPPFRLFAMKTQWGNCSPNGRLTLNLHLIKASTACIDYVLLHELCHIAEHNHSDRFYRLMSQVMPQWEEVKQRLDQMACKLIA